MMDGALPRHVCVGLSNYEKDASIEFRSCNADGVPAHYIHVTGLTPDACQALGEQLIRAAARMREGGAP